MTCEYLLANCSVEDPKLPCTTQKSVRIEKIIFRHQQRKTSEWPTESAHLTKNILRGVEHKKNMIKQRSPTFRDDRGTSSSASSMESIGGSEPDFSSGERIGVPKTSVEEAKQAVAAGKWWIIKQYPETGRQSRICLDPVSMTCRSVHGNGSAG